jgi:hypothetical protein
MTCARRRAGGFTYSLFVALVIAATGVLVSGRASADVPSNDPSAQGSIGLCSKDLQPITHGSIHDKPFAWRAVSSVTPPPPYDAPGGKGTLYIYQPRPGVMADQWNGDSMTAASTFTNPGHPMAQATELDFSLADFLNEFPTLVDGRLQLRMFVGARGVGTLASSYPATDIRVAGDTWAEVTPVIEDCRAGSAVSSEIAAGALARSSASAAKSAVAHASGSTGIAHSRSGSSPTTGASASGAAPANQSSGSASANQSAAALLKPRHAHSWITPLIVGLVVLAFGSAGGLLWWRRRAVS